MNKDTVKGTINDAAGRIERQVGEWTGDGDAQIEGAAQQAKGKAQKAWGKVKDAARDVSEAIRDAKSNATQELEKDKREDGSRGRS